MSRRCYKNASDGAERPSDPQLWPPLCTLRAFPFLYAAGLSAGSWVGTKGTWGSSVRNQLQSLLSGKCRWIEHSWRVSGKWEKQGTGPVEVVTGVTAPRLPLVRELYVRNYRTNVTALLPTLRVQQRTMSVFSLPWMNVFSQTEGTRCKISQHESIITNMYESSCSYISTREVVSSG